MLEASTLCPAEVQVGWYYNENTNTFLSPEQYSESQNYSKTPKQEPELAPELEPNKNTQNPKNPRDQIGYVLPMPDDPEF